MFRARIALLAVLSVVMSHGSAQTVSRLSGQVLFIEQADGDARSRAGPSVRVTLAPPIADGVTFAVATTRSRELAISAQAAFKGLDLGDIDRDRAPEAVLASATAAIDRQWPALRTRMHALLRASGAGFVSFRVRQRVPAADAARPLYLGFAATVDAAGHGLRTGPTLRAAPPVYLDATYTPVRASADVAPQWAYPDAGVLRWQVVDALGRRAGAARQLQTDGAYDERESQGAEDPVVPTRGVDCLVDHARCPADAPSNGRPPGFDLRSLMAQAGADGVLLRYRRPVQAACVERRIDGHAVCDRLYDGIAVTRRSLGWSACAAAGVYRVSGYAGYALEATTLRFWIDAHLGTAAWIDQRSDRYDARARPFDRTVLLDAASARTIAWQSLPNPLAARPALIPIEQLGSRLVELAPLQVQADAMRVVALPDMVTAGSPLVHAGRDDMRHATRWQNRFACRADGRVQYRAWPQPVATQAVPGAAVGYIEQVLPWQDFLDACRRGGGC